MKSILRLRHWQIFPILLAGLFLSNFTIDDNQTLTTILSITGATICFLWPLLIGIGLYKFLPEEINLNYNLFIINSFIWITAYIVFAIIYDMTLNFLPGFYLFYAFIHYLTFPARTLKSIEKGEKAVLGEYIGDLLLIIFLPVGIWFLQPRINKVIEGREEKIKVES